MGWCCRRRAALGENFGRASWQQAVDSWRFSGAGTQPARTPGVSERCAATGGRQRAGAARTSPPAGSAGRSSGAGCQPKGTRSQRAAHGLCPKVWPGRGHPCVCQSVSGDARPRDRNPAPDAGEGRREPDRPWSSPRSPLPHPGFG